MGENTSCGVTGHTMNSDINSIPLVFMQESAVFGDRKPSKSEWINHVELYSAISNRIDSSHLTGLQRVRGLWRIYVDNLQDKVKLMEEGVPMRGKIIPVLNTNPQRPDGENTIRIRIKNIPLSADDGIITRVLTLRGIEIISITRDKLRIQGRLTNCETGDRLVVVKSTSLQEPLPNFMMFGVFTARVFHVGQVAGSRPDVKCTKCLKTGHKYNQCENDWVCRTCNQPGHKQSECTAHEDADQDTNTDSEAEVDVEQPSKDAESAESVPLSPQKPAKPRRVTSLSRDPRPKTQPTMDKYTKTNQSDPSDTPEKAKRGNTPERSLPTPTDAQQEKTTKKVKQRKK